MRNRVRWRTNNTRKGKKMMYTHNNFFFFFRFCFNFFPSLVDVFASLYCRCCILCCRVSDFKRKLTMQNRMREWDRLRFVCCERVYLNLNKLCTRIHTHRFENRQTACSTKRIYLKSAEIKILKKKCRKQEGERETESEEKGKSREQYQENQASSLKDTHTHAEWRQEINSQWFDENTKEAVPTMMITTWQRRWR